MDEHEGEECSSESGELSHEGDVVAGSVGEGGHGEVAAGSSMDLSAAAWDDGALIRSWDDAMRAYKVCLALCLLPFRARPLTHLSRVS